MSSELHHIRMSIQWQYRYICTAFVLAQFTAVTVSV